MFDCLLRDAGPDQLEAVIVELVEKQRPELKGCNVFAIEYDLALIGGGLQSVTARCPSARSAVFRQSDRLTRLTSVTWKRRHS
jgi:hypothetical protein